MRTQRSWLGQRLPWALVFAAAALGAAGCDGPRRSAPTGASTSTEAPPAAAEPAPAAAAVEPAAPPPTIQKPADVGAGKRGHDLGQGIVATPVAAYFAAQEQVAFRVEVPQAMNLFKAEKGYAPRSNEEFMKEIIQANNIKLPELPAGHKYIYDPAQEQLMVEQPGQ